MNENRFESENAWYHFLMEDVTNAMRLYGYDVVMKDITDTYQATIKTVEHIYD
ncbi:hypothetical protein UFOVP507_19 [uncultured Caudovirales phage]|jgi:hypothetical protein|uniref:Uncharacterized protein n=1 Tax=uncultured Caudovirales phage TaxID=2100421 RepID=A0A6J5MKE8_9CAUD|nr:hypothetical protein UFOVP507_19 [uncultured Caudovirales phage]